MTPDPLKTLIPEYLTGDLSPDEKQTFERRMDADPTLRIEVEELREVWNQLGLLPLPEPSISMRSQFYQKLNATLRDKPQVKAWWKLPVIGQVAAACAIFALGLGVGHLQLQPNPKPQEISQLQSQVEALRQTVALSLMEKPSASSRLEGVEWGSQVDRPDQELTAALLTTLNQDQNINVRLAALDALEKFTSDTGVRKALEQSIPKQQSPLVQIALIDALVHIRDRSAAQEFKQLSGNAQVNAVVRQRAQWAVEKLSLN